MRTREGHETADKDRQGHRVRTRGHTMEDGQMLHGGAMIEEDFVDEKQTTAASQFSQVESNQQFFHANVDFIMTFP